MQPSTRRLSEVARHLVYPDGIKSTVWPQVKKRLAAMAVEYDGWQEGVATIVLGLDEHGRYTATVGGVTMSLPRQVGKTFTIGSLLVAMCIEFPGLRVVWTSHHLRTTTNTFRAMQGMVRRKKIAPHLAHNGIRTANGEQEIRFLNGSIIMFGARERGFGVGIDAIDVLVCDEAQRLTSRALADMVPTTNQARHLHGALLFFIGTPPRPTDDGDEFADRRADALAGTLLDGVYVEMSADDDADYDKHEQWGKANPSFPHRTPLESMLRLRKNLKNADDWRREAMGVWDKAAAKKPDVFGAGKWAACAKPDLRPDVPAVISIAVSVDRDWTSIAAGSMVEVPGPDGEPIEIPFIAAVERREGVDWAVQRAKAIQDAYDCTVVIDEKGPTKDLLVDLEEADVAVETVTLDGYAEGCSRLVDAVRAGRAAHNDSAELNAAVEGATWRTVGDRQVWGRRKSANDVSMLEAGTLAARAADLVGAFNVY